MKYWFDTEFIDDGKTIDLISIGIISEDGRMYYAESNEFDEAKACEWVQKNVIAILDGGGKSRSQIRDEVRAFVGDDAHPEFWTYYGAYDWVVFCQLWGTMLSLPPAWPNLCMDIKQLSIVMGNVRFPEQATTKHNALNDAIWTKEAWEVLRDYRTKGRETA